MRSVRYGGHILLDMSFTRRRIPLFPRVKMTSRTLSPHLLLALTRSGVPPFVLLFTTHVQRQCVVMHIHRDTFCMFTSSSKRKITTLPYYVAKQSRKHYKEGTESEGTTPSVLTVRSSISYIMGCVSSSSPSVFDKCLNNHPSIKQMGRVGRTGQPR